MALKQVALMAGKKVVCSVVWSVGAWAAYLVWTMDAHKVEYLEMQLVELLVGVLVGKMVDGKVAYQDASSVEQLALSKAQSKVEKMEMLLAS